MENGEWRMQNGQFPKAESLLYFSVWHRHTINGEWRIWNYELRITNYEIITFSGICIITFGGICIITFGGICIITFGGICNAVVSHNRILNSIKMKSGNTIAAQLKLNDIRNAHVWRHLYYHVRRHLQCRRFTQSNFKFD